MSWLSALPAVAAAAGILLVPGFLAMLPLRMGFVARMALSGLVGVAVLGVSGVLAALAGIPFTALAPLVVGLMIGLVSFLFQRMHPGFALRGDGIRRRWLLLVWMLSAVLIAVVAFWRVPDPTLISQTYDNLFHLSAIAHIQASGDASSLDLRALIEPGRSFAFYPAGWHSLVVLAAALSGSGVAVAANASWIAICAVLWLPGCAWLAQVLLRRLGAGTAALVALPLATAFAAMPYALLSWGTLYPTFLATALLPASLAAIVLFVRRIRAAPSPQRRGVLIAGVAVALLSCCAITVSQPRVLASLVLVLAPFLAAEASSAWRALWRRGGRSRRGAIIALLSLILLFLAAAAVSWWYLVTKLGLFSRPLDDRLGGPQARATQSVATGILQVLAQSWPRGVTTTVPAVALAVAVAGGIVFSLCTRRLRWVVVSYALLGVLFALAAGSDAVWVKLATGIWYKDRYRIDSVMPVLGVVLASAAVLWVCRAWRSRGRGREAAVPRGRSAAALGLSGLVALITSVGLIFGGTSASIGRVFEMPQSHATDAIVSKAQIAFMRSTVPAIVPAGERVLGDPWDGSGLSGLYSDREAVFPHVNGQWDADRLLLASHLADIRTDPAVCQALDRLRVRYILSNPHTFGGGDPSGDKFAGVREAVALGLFLPVASDGETTLLKITECGPLPGAS